MIAPHLPAPAEVISSGHDVRVLLVDDDALYGTIVRRLLRVSGMARFDVQQVCTYDEALEAVPGRFDVVLLDYHLGRHTGLELLQQWRTRGELTPVIMLTATSEQTVDVAAAQSGAYDYVDKADLDGPLLERAVRYAISIDGSLRQLREALDVNAALLRATTRLVHTTADELRRDIVRGAVEDLGASDAVIADAETPRTSPPAPTITRSGNGTVGVFPLTTADGCNEALTISSQDAAFFTSLTIGALTTYAQHAAVSLRAVRLQEQFQHAQKLEAIGRLAGGIAHDFNNLLTAILGHTEMLLDDQLPPDVAVQVREIQRAGERSAQLTAQLLAFARRQVLKVEPVVIDEVVQGMTTLVARLLGEDVNLHVSAHCHGTTIVADRGQLEQVVMNLAVNARDAMTQGGTLTLATERVVLREPETAHEGLIAPGEYAVLRVTDTGQGMDASTMARIFEPFFTTKEVGRGTGLGLPMVLGVVHQSGGRLTVRSAPGQGTTLTMFFPVALQPGTAVAQQPLASVPQASRQATGRILVVEDQRQVRELARRALVARGYDVATAENGEAALQVLASSTPFDLILSDVVMPRMGGQRLIEALRAQAYPARLLFMSGYSPEAAQVTVWPHATGYIGKPFTPRELTHKVEELLRQ